MKVNIRLEMKAIILKSMEDVNLAILNNQDTEDIYKYWNYMIGQVCLYNEIFDYDQIEIIDDANSFISSVYIDDDLYTFNFITHRFS